MGQGPVDHPSYIARQEDYLGATTAGNATVSLKHAALSAKRLRNFGAVVATAGTATGASLTPIVITGTVTTTGTGITLSTNTAGVAVIGAVDQNLLVPSGSVLAFINGTDATCVANVSAQWHIDAQGTWLGG